MLKYSPVGAKFSGYNADNDYIAERYSNVLLMKAEALFRMGKNADEALKLVNQVRTRPLRAVRRTFARQDREGARP